LSEGGIPERRPDCLASNPFSISDVLEGASSLNKPKLFLLGFAVPSLAHAQALCSQSATAAQHCLTPKNQLGERAIAVRFISLFFVLLLGCSLKEFEA
jgi:hypothetical protein